MAESVAYCHHTYHQSSGFLRTPRDHHSSLQTTCLGKKERKKKGKRNTIHSNLTSSTPCRCIWSSTPTRAVMRRKTSASGNLTVNTDSYVRDMSQVLIKSEDFKFSTNSRNCDPKDLWPSILAKPKRQTLYYSTGQKHTKLRIVGSKSTRHRIFWRRHPSRLAI